MLVFFAVCLWKVAQSQASSLVLKVTSLLAACPGRADAAACHCLCRPDYTYSGKNVSHNNFMIGKMSYKPAAERALLCACCNPGYSFKSSVPPPCHKSLGLSKQVLSCEQLSGHPLGSIIGKLTSFNLLEIGQFMQKLLEGRCSSHRLNSVSSDGAFLVAFAFAEVTCTDRLPLSAGNHLKPRLACTQQLVQNSLIEFMIPSQ